MKNFFKNIFREGNLDYEFLPTAIELAETPPSPFNRVLIWIMLLIMLSIFIWSYFGKIDEVAVARGKIVPDGHVKVIQPLETSVIRAIHVKEGQRVTKGQLLIELDPTIKQADVESTERALFINKIDRERLISELNGNELSIKKKGDLPELQKKLKKARELEYKAKEDAIKFIIAQKEDELQSVEANLSKLEKIYAILKEQNDSYKNLYEQGYLAKINFLEKQIALSSAEHELESQKKIVQLTKSALEEKIKNFEALKKEREKDILNNMVEAEKNINLIGSEAKKARRKFELEKLCSPANGTVHGLAFYTIGGVVTSAQPVVTIVPDGTPLIVEATTLNKDIGFLRVGQEAEVKFDTFPFQKYGTIKGKVAWLSPDALDDQKLGLVYKMRIEIEKQSLNINNREVSISSGMSLSAEVKTGKKRIIEFFLSPLIKHTRESLSLR